MARAGMPTTAACPSFSHVPKKTAPAVQKLLDKGLKGGAQELQGEKLFQNLDQGLKGLFGPR